ncbi:TAR DNA-binding protein 43 [Fasciola hepatica]|uniref:TAR DNA-binding protein 43 n=1 Tax=Fasciola hepatica TaxID=6192 RepID=A0A4E0QUS2_FASHE|nr:TAR DNA-binding protein 43 [Fasciola hepatica]
MAGVSYIRVSEDDEESPIEIPIETDGSVLLTTLNGVFPKATGLKYMAPDSGCYRGVRLNDGKLYAPDEGWVHTYVCVFPKSDEDQDSLSAKSKKLEGKKCTDLIVLNLAWKTDEAALRDYFSRYGELVMVQVKRHPGTQQSKGYGFIRFSEYESQPMCLAERHYIDGRWCDVRVPMSKLEGDKQEVSRKVHVGGVTEKMTADALREYFLQFGQVLDVFVPKPFRSFAFVTFEDAETAAGLLGKELTIDGSKVTIGSAVPKLPPQPARHYNAMQQQMSVAMPPNPWDLEMCVCSVQIQAGPSIPSVCRTSAA